MNDDRFEEDPELSRLLRAVRADADPALWTRVRARIESRQHVPALLRWAMRPAALAASFALLVATGALGLLLAAGTPIASGEEYGSLGEALLAERDAELAGAPGSHGPASPDGAASDTGGPR
jgi:hypothetical protein